MLLHLTRRSLRTKFTDLTEIGICTNSKYYWYFCFKSYPQLAPNLSIFTITDLVYSQRKILLTNMLATCSCRFSVKYPLKKVTEKRTKIDVRFSRNWVVEPLSVTLIKQQETNRLSVTRNFMFLDQRQRRPISCDIKFFKYGRKQKSLLSYESGQTPQLMFLYRRPSAGKSLRPSDFHLYDK